MSLTGRLKAWFAEAQRRRVFRTTGVYLVGVWVISQGVAELAPIFGAPQWLLRVLMVGAVALTPAVVILAWMFDIGRQGITRDPQDLERAQRDRDLAEMQTQIGPSAAIGTVVVGWSDPDGEHRIDFAEDFFIGRASDCRVRFYDPLVSRKHARVFHADGRWRIEDLGSRNGTTFAGKRIDSMVLEPGKAGEIRVNEAGPPLLFEVVAPGEETTMISAPTATTASAAHIRAETLEAPRPRKAVTIQPETEAGEPARTTKP